MFSWIEKVIPQPPETPRKSSADSEECMGPPTVVTAKCDEKPPCEAAGPPVKADVQVPTTADDSSGGVLGWLAQGLGKVVPQPVDSPTLSRVKKEVLEASVATEVPKPVAEAAVEKTENGPPEQPDRQIIDGKDITGEMKILMF
ncbi:cyclic nucleotide-gated channel beta-1-like [Gastrophryne carolinensis]